TVGVLQRGPADPTMVITNGVIWRAQRTELGVATVALRQRAGEIHATAWGPGAEVVIDHVPALCGAHDDISGFDAAKHPLIERLATRLRGLRLARTDQVFDAI